MSDETYTLGDIIAATDPSVEDNTSALTVNYSGPSNDVLKRFFDENYPNVKIDQATAKSIGKSIASIRFGGSAGVRLICQGHDCEFAGACPLIKTKVGAPQAIRDAKTGQTTIVQQTLAPEGQSCPLEEAIVTDTRFKYSKEFIDVDADEVILQSYINDLCQIAMLEWRCGMLMGYDNTSVLQKVPGAVTSDGRIVSKFELSPIMELLERLQQRRARILTDLVMTPREKYKKEHAVGDKNADKLSKTQAEMRLRIKEKTGSKLPDIMKPPKHITEAKDKES